MTTEPNVAEVVGRLSEAGRAAFARSADEDMHPDHAGRISTYGDRDTAHELFALGLIKRLGTFSLLTPLGLACRQYLADQSS